MGFGSGTPIWSMKNILTNSKITKIRIQKKGTDPHDQGQVKEILNLQLALY